MSLVVNPYAYFTDTNGDALNGYLYIGEVGKNAENYPIAIYYDALLTTPAPNPLTISAGYIYNGGTIAQIYAAVDYSLIAKTTGGNLVYSSLNESGMTNGAIANVDEMKNFVAPYDNYVLNVLGYSEAGDGGGGLFYYDANSTEDDNGGTIIEPTSGSGRWVRVYDFVKLEYFGVESPDYALDSNWTWDSTVDKSTANLGTIIDPSVGLDEQGTGSGFGCMVRQYSGAVNVKWFGAVGDGIADDTLSIQGALNSSNSVYLPSGSYLTTNTIKYNTNNFIYGDGESSEIKLNTGAVKPMFYPSGVVGIGFSVDNVTFKDITLNHNITDAGYFVESIMTIVALSTKRLHISNVHFKNPSGDCIYISKRYGSDSSDVRPYDIKIVNCRFSGTNINRNAISIITGEEILIDGNYFYKITKSNMPSPIDLEPNNISETIYNVCISNNTFNGCKGGISSYITGTTYSDYSSIRNISITGNNFFNQYNITPYVAESQACIAIYNASNVTIDSNNLYSPADVGIAIARSAGVNCSGNNITNPSLGGIRILDIQKSKVDNNSITLSSDAFNGVSCYGIDIDTAGFIASTNWAFFGGSLDNNTILCTAASPTVNTGIGMQGNCQNLRITGIVSGFKTGIYLGRRSDLAPTLNRYDIDLSQNTVPFVFSFGASTPKSLVGFNLGEGVTFGQGSFSASTSVTLTGLPTRTTSKVRVTRIGTVGIANTLSASVPSAGQLTITSSASESGSFLWEIVQL